MAFPAALERVMETLEGAGYEAYAVGGGVRDTLRGIAPQDWDVTTSARPEDVLSLFGEAAIPTGLPHGTVTVRSGAQHFEVTTYRTDGLYTDHRRPESVSFTASLEEDLARRDFTVNAMAMDHRGNLVDPFGGQADLARGLLRCVGDPDRRFSEDTLRIMRALRFSAQLGFAIEEDTERALRAHAEELRHIAVERITAEMNGLLCGSRATEVLLRFPEVLGVFLPEILPCVGFDQHSKFHIYDIWEHIARSVGYVPPQPLLRWVMLLHDLGKPRRYTQEENGTGHFFGHAEVSAVMAEDICRRMRFSGAQREAIVTLVAWHDRAVLVTKRGITRALNALGEEGFFALCAVKRADNLAQNPAYRRIALVDEAEALARELLAEHACFSLKDLAVNGRDIAALGYQGAEIGTALNTLLSQVMDGVLPNEKAALLRAAKDNRIQ